MKKIVILVAETNFIDMTLKQLNNKRRELIHYSMVTQKINKKNLSIKMNVSVPTIGTKIDNPGTLKLSEADRLCNILGIDLTKFLTIK